MGRKVSVFSWILDKFVSVAFEVLMVENMKMAVFRLVVPCSLVEGNRRFRGECCLHRQGDDCPDDGCSNQL
jgi:hypothetical protein